VLVGVAIRLAYVLITSGHTPVNDELEYHREAIFIANRQVVLVDLALRDPARVPGQPPLFPLWVGLW
jgi:hypothetical protein